MAAEYMMTNRSVNVNSYLMYVAIGEDQKMEFNAWLPGELSNFGCSQFRV